MTVWRTRRFEIDLSRPRVMGIVNVTPDSFSDGGRFHATDAACAHCDRLVGEGADLLDIGGESTRPGAAPPDPGEEAARVLPVLRHAVTLGVPVSVDTSDPALMRQALELGVDVINDVRAFRRPGAWDVLAADGQLGACLMHMPSDAGGHAQASDCRLGHKPSDPVRVQPPVEPDRMQRDPRYVDVVREVRDFLAERLRVADTHGIDRRRLVVDPGYGFGKTLAHNLALSRRQPELLDLGVPLLAGWSRKGSLGALTGRPVQQRTAASVGAALAAVRQGAAVVRVHDVAATVDALRVWCALTVTVGDAPYN